MNILTADFSEILEPRREYTDTVHSLRKKKQREREKEGMMKKIKKRKKKLKKLADRILSSKALIHKIKERPSKTKRNTKTSLPLTQPYKPDVKERATQRSRE